MGSTETLALKLVLTRLLVGGASLAARRWGSEVGGWVVGIPFTSAPVSQAAFALAYSWCARRAA